MVRQAIPRRTLSAATCRRRGKGRTAVLRSIHEVSIIRHRSRPH